MLNVFILAVLLGTIPLALFNPVAGVMIYYWMTFLDPVQLGWAVPGDRWIQLIALVTIARAFVFPALTLRLHALRANPISFATLLLLAFVGWMAITSVVAIDEVYAWRTWQIVAKRFLMVFVTLTLICTRPHIHALVWTLVLAVGFHTVKAGAFVLVAPGDFDAVGTPGSLFGETNELARGAIMILPLIVFLMRHSFHRLVRVGLTFAALFTVLALVGTNSRGGFLAFAGMSIFAWAVFARRRVTTLAAILIAMIPLTVIVPQARTSGWLNRIASVSEIEKDPSAQGRFDAWQYALDIGETHPLTGLGFGAFLGTTDSHSNYFSLLGEHGYVGLVIYLAFVGCLIVTAVRLRHPANDKHAPPWMRDLSIATQVSIVGYLLGGLTISHAYYELFYVTAALLIAVYRLKNSLKDSDTPSKLSPDELTSRPRPL